MMVLGCNNMGDGRAQVLLCEQDPDAPGLTVEQRRKIRRRINNRASAQRVRAKREQDLAIASAQARPCPAPAYHNTAEQKQGFVSDAQARGHVHRGCLGPIASHSWRARRGCVPLLRPQALAACTQNARCALRC
jgi:hypothetical protein